jgi:hypothetical protein
LFEKDVKRVHFSTGKAPKVSLFGEESKRKEYIPGANKYSPKEFYKTLGTIKL